MFFSLLWFEVFSAGTISSIRFNFLDSLLLSWLNCFVKVALMNHKHSVFRFYISCVEGTVVYMAAIKVMFTFQRRDCVRNYKLSSVLDIPL